MHADPELVSELRALLERPDTNREVRAYLLLLWSLVPDSEVAPTLTKAALHDDDWVALVATRALMARLKDLLGYRPAVEHIRSFWIGLFFDARIGGHLRPGYIARHAEDTGPRPRSPDSVWDRCGVSATDTPILELLRSIVLEGHSVPARSVAIRETPPSSERSQMLRELVSTDACPAVLRGVAYEHMSRTIEDQPYFRSAMQRETDPRVLAGLCTLLDTSTPQHRDQSIEILERIAPLAADDKTFADRLTTALSLSDCRRGIEALVGIARNGESHLLRASAVAAMSYCPMSTQIAEDRIQALSRMTLGEDLPTAAVAACSLISATRRAGLSQAASRAIDSTVLARAGQLASMDCVPAGVRAQLQYLIAAHKK